MHAFAQPIARLLSLFLLLNLARPALAQIPERMQWCGMDIHTDASAREKMQATIDLHTKSPRYFQTLVDKADTWMPVVEEALSWVGVPDDLKYIALMESSLRGDAVSSSGAVGYWQMKAQAARECGLRIDESVDERRHIFRASLGAARYLRYLNQTFDNWLYAVIAYNQGGGGALAHVDPAQYGSRSLRVTGSTHAYALKALAFYHMFHGKLYQGGRSITWLEPRSTGGGRDLRALAAAEGISWEDFRAHNPWALTENLPDGTEFTWYKPHVAETTRVQMPEPVLPRSEGELWAGFPLAEKKVKTPAAGTGNAGTGNAGSGAGNGTAQGNASSTAAAALLPADLSAWELISPESDPEWGKTYTVLRPGESLVEAAVRLHKKTLKLAEWNGLEAGENPAAGQALRLRPARKQKYHLVGRGETLGSIAALYGLPESSLRSLNRLRSGENPLPGQKLWLRKPRPAAQKAPLLRLPALNGLDAATAATLTPASPPTSPPAPAAAGNTHTVASGDTLYRIATKYGTTVEEIRRLNDLRSDRIYPGQVLRVPTR